MEGHNKYDLIILISALAVVRRTYNLSYELQRRVQDLPGRTWPRW